MTVEWVINPTREEYKTEPIPVRLNLGTALASVEIYRGLEGWRMIGNLDFPPDNSKSVDLGGGRRLAGLKEIAEEWLRYHAREERP